MSKEGNMEELQRYQNSVRMQLVPSDKGVWVRFSDVEEREARFQARIEELEGIVSGKTMYDAASVADARWRERIESKAERLESLARAQADEFGNYITSAGRSGDYKEGRADAYDDAADALRSLLDSGEQKECPACDGYGWVSCVTGKGADPKGAVDSLDGCPFCTKPGECGGSGHRATTPSPALEECTNCDGTGTRFSEVAWDDLTCGRCNGNKAVPAGSQEGKFGGPGGRRPSPSPALEGREER